MLDPCFNRGMNKEQAININNVVFAKMSNDQLQMHYDCASKNIRAFRYAQWSFRENGKIVRMSAMPFIVNEMRNRGILN